jgi:hypothetical protein
MAQPFTCLCGTPTCRGRIAGARDMTPAQLAGLWLNGHVRELLEEREAAAGPKKQATNGTSSPIVNGNGATNGSTNGHHAAQSASSAHAPAGAQRRGPTSRELSGEMGGDTSVSV